MVFHFHPAYRWGLGLGLVLGLGSAGLKLATTLARLEAADTGSAMRAAWAVSTRTGPSSFSLHRKLPGQPGFRLLGSLAPAGYARPGRMGPLPGPVPYRLRLRGPAYAYPTAGPGPTTPLQRAWGTIKAMFR